jgi:glycine/D-amino acid oxidase-like deaminating enzyme
LTRVVVPDPSVGRSFWLQEALQHDPGERCPPLDGYVRADVCIVGGGFTGLWTAIRLTEREPGMRIALLDKDIVGGGASGRNGGFFSTSWFDLEALVGFFGEADGLAYAEVLADSVGEAEKFCGEHGIDCWFHRGGTLIARTEEWQELHLARDLGIGGRPRLRHLDAEGCRAIASSPRFIDGVLSVEDGTVQPARLARGLRRVLLERGVNIFERTGVRAIERATPAIVRTDLGAVKADHVVLATGAWAASWPGFRRSFGVIGDYVVATEPIPDRLEEIGWTSRTGIGDARAWLHYLRTTDDARIVIGGGAGTAVFAGRGDGQDASGRRRYAEAPARGLLWMFPQLEGVRFTHAWGGPIDQTSTFLPFFRTLPPGNVHAGLGFSGHGLAQTFVAGNILASRVLGVSDRWTALPVNRPETSKTPPEPLRYPLVRASAYALERGDRRKQEGKRRGLWNSVAGGAPVAWREWLVGRELRKRERQGPRT